MTGIVEGYKPRTVPERELGGHKPEFVGFIFPSGTVSLERAGSTEYDQQEHFGDVAAMVDAVKKEYGTDFILLISQHEFTRSVKTVKVDLARSAEPAGAKE